MTFPTRNSDSARADGAPDLRTLSRKYPLTVRNFGALPDREAWLRRVWELEAHWQETMEQRSERAHAPEVIIDGAPPAGARIEAEFDIVYAGGVLGLLHAAVMATVHRRRVLVFDAHTVGRTHRDWNISSTLR